MNNHTNIITKIDRNSKQAYLPHTDKLPLVVVNYIRQELLKNENDDVKALFSILRKETELCLRKNEGYAPISWELLNKNKYTEAIKRLRELDLVEYIDHVSPQNGRAGKSKEYRIKLPLFYRLSNMTCNRVDSYIEDGFTLYNGITGKPIRLTKKDKTHQIYKYNKKKKQDELIVSEVVAKGIEPIKYCYFNYKLVEEYLDFLKEQWLLGNLSKKKELRYMNDERCYASVLERPFIVLEKEFKGMLLYQPSYRGQRTGRKSEIGGGFQSCSRDMKQVGFAYSRGTRNYDLKSSQIYCLKYQFMSARLNYGLLDNYLSADKGALAAAVGIDKDTWKGINYGAYFGGFPTKKLKTIKVSGDRKKDYGTLNSLLSYEVVSRHICNFLNIKTWYNNQARRRECEIKYNGNVNVTLVNIYAILKRFYDQNQDLLEELITWHKYLATDFLQSNTVAIKDKKYIINRSDMPIEVTQFMNSKGKVSTRGQRKIASHLLQGQEAQFISRLTWYSEKYKDCPYRVMSDQHDGLIVQGFITDKYVDMARQDTGFTEAYLVEKEYSDKEYCLV